LGSSSAFTYEIRVPVVRRKRPVTTPFGHTKKLGQQDSRAEEVGQLIQRRLFAASATIAAGMVMLGVVATGAWRAPLLLPPQAP
jgi:hypothetical protein